MKTGFKYAAIAWVVGLLLMPLIAPLLAPGGDMRALGQLWAPLSLFLVGVPAFAVGFFRQRRR